MISPGHGRCSADVRCIPVAWTWLSSLPSGSTSSPFLARMPEATSARWEISWADLEAAGDTGRASYSIILSSVVHTDSGVLAPLQANEVNSHVPPAPSWNSLSRRQPVPSSLPWELSAPHQLGPTAKGHFSLKPAPWTKPKGTLGSGVRPSPGHLK